MTTCMKKSSNFTDPHSVLTSRFGYYRSAHDAFTFSPEEIDAKAAFLTCSAEEARRKLVDEAVDLAEFRGAANIDMKFLDRFSTHSSRWLRAAVQANETDEARALLHLGADVTDCECGDEDDSWSVVHIAAASANVEMLSLLLEPPEVQEGESADGSGETRIALPTNRLEELVNLTGGAAMRTPLLLACGAKRYESLPTTAMANIGGPGRDRAGAEELAVVQLLLAKAADPNLVDVDECSCLMYADARPDIFRALLDHGADPNHVTYSGVRVKFPQGL